MAGRSYRFPTLRFPKQMPRSLRFSPKLESFGYVIFLVSLLVFGLLLFWHVTKPCLPYGYTLCSAIGEDFFSAYQAGSNVLSGHLIFGPDAEADLKVPYSMKFLYLPATAFTFDVIFFSLDPSSVYSAYDVYSFALVFLSALSSVLTFYFARKLGCSRKTALVASSFWLFFFPYLSEWRLGQFNQLAGFFILLVYGAIALGKKSGLFWNLSILAKPLALPSVLYLVKRREVVSLALLSAIIASSIAYLLVTNTLSYAIADVSNRGGFYTRYVDSFGYASIISEFVYDTHAQSLILYSSAFAVLAIAVYIGYKSKMKSTSDILYFVIFLNMLTLLTRFEWFEATLTFMLPSIAFLFILEKREKGRVFIFLMYLLLATPSLYYFYSTSSTDLAGVIRPVMVLEKFVPMLSLFLYTAYLNSKSMIKRVRGYLASLI